MQVIASENVKLFQYLLLQKVYPSQTFSDFPIWMNFILFIFICKFNPDYII